MDRIRHILAVVAIVIYGPGLLFWFLIHPFVRFWRRLGPLITYVIVCAIVIMIGVAAFQIREALVGRNFGTNWNLIILGTILFGSSGWLGLAYGLRLNHLNAATRMGLPELSRSVARETLVLDGFYGVIRHPIYCFAIVYGIAYALIVNYSGIYILFGAAVPVLYAITILEERELIDRFGESYRKYRQEVPRLFPHPRRLFRFRQS